ncbi:hypothetical protein Taro_046324, partial [Colocasia esculenta]|nr:hypothetical protein [Colocasia esculenta]
RLSSLPLNPSLPSSPRHQKTSSPRPCSLRQSMSCAAPPQPPQPAAAAALAPGFRFHPTDEELVSFYLKRKVAGRPFRVDAISEIDLYKVEPWDLPGKSRIRSRDTEWYFFSALDKKYSNRSRTNRATGSGYWKTTGKDRAVCRGGRTVGMKKTLVFHVGRAPKGDRTNWVMHEYRLEDEELARAGFLQDAYVVCRIFQKRGPGPQNGAQYGAPFVEEEWEDDELPALKKDDGGDDLNVLSNSAPTEVDNYEQIKDTGAQLEKNTPLVDPDQQDDFDFFDPDGLLKICEDKLLSNVDDGNIEVLGQQSDENPEGIGIGSDALDQSQSLAVLNDEFLEVNDFAFPMETNTQEGVICPEEVHNDMDFIIDESSSQQDLCTVEDFLNADDENNQPIEQFSPCQTIEDNCFLGLDYLLGPELGHCPGEPNGDEMPYFDASNHNLDAAVSTDMKCFMDSAIGDSSGPDLVDELIAYFDATENMQTFDLDLKCEANTSNQTNLALVNELNVPGHQSSPQPADMDGHNSSLLVTPDADEKSTAKSINVHGESESQYDNGWDKSFTKRLVSMLGTIPSPPAYAAEFPVKQAKSIENSSTVHSSSSVHVATGMVQIHGVTMSGTGKNWSVLKNRDENFLLSYDMTSGESGNLAGYDTMPKMPGGVMPFIMRNSFHLLFLSVLFLAASFKIWVYIYGR